MEQKSQNDTKSDRSSRSNLQQHGKNFEKIPGGVKVKETVKMATLGSARNQQNLLDFVESS